jgi:hypothetical protein
VRILAVIALLVCLLVRLGMSFLRITNLEYDVRVLAQDVARLKASAAAPSVPPATVPGAVPLATAPTAAPSPSPAVTPFPGFTPAVPMTPVVALTRGFLDDGAEQQVVPLPARMARARVTILAIEGEGTGEKALPEPIDFTLQAGVPQAVHGICTGPESAAWVFTLEPAALRVTSRECEYPVRGLRPRLRISAVP